MFLTLKARHFALILVSLAAIPLNGVSAAEDPVARFIASVDSLAKAQNAVSLASYVGKHSIMCGAAVGTLLDEAIKAGDGADKAAENEKFSAAERIAGVYREATGSRAPLDLVKTYRSWTSQQRAVRAKAKGLEEEAAQARKVGDLDKAVRLLEEARVLYAKIDDRRSTAVIWGSLGVAHWNRNDWDAVRTSYENALTQRRAIDDHILVGRTLNGLGTLNFQTGAYAAAIDFYAQAVRLRRMTGDLGGLGTSLTYMGNAYVRLGRLAEARDKFAEAFAILEKDGTPQQMVDVLNGSANAYFEMGRLREACETYRRAIEIARAAQDARKEISCRLNLADALKFMGRYRESLAELERAGELIAVAPDPQQVAELARNSGNVNREMGELDRARDDYLAFLSKSKELGDVVYQIEAFISLGLLYRDLGAIEQGLACADSAMAMARRTGESSHLREALVLAGGVEYAGGRNERALDHLAQALEKDSASGFELNVFNDRSMIANVLAALGRREEARQEFRRIGSAAKDHGIDLESACEFGIADTYERENPDSAYAHYEKAFRLLEASRSEIGAAETQTGFLSGDRRRLFEEVARYYVSLESSAESGLWSARAFDTIERGKARGLLDLLERSVVAQSSPAEEAVLDSLYRLDRNAREYAERETALKSRYAQLREERLGRSVGALAPGGGVVSLEDLMRSLPKGTVLLEYALGDTTSLFWAVDRAGATVYRLAARSVLSDEVERLRDAVSRPGPGDASFLAAARSLYKQLLEPAGARVDKAKRLVIIPDGVLFELPFEVLLAGEPTAGARWKDQPFLARSCGTVYAPSASVFFRLTSKKDQEAHVLELIAMGDPDLSSVGRQGDPALRPLPYSRAEVEGISALLDRKREEVFVGRDATEARLKEVLRASPPRILHLAAHGFADPVEPINSSIILGASTDPVEDGQLYTLEILSLPTAPELIVMSACESAGGMISRGEGVVGLSRAFLAAGARGVVASLWPVSDASTAGLMKTFYGAMLRSHEPAFEALRRARLSLLDSSQFAHPFYWAPFILIGTERTPW